MALITVLPKRNIGRVLSMRPRKTIILSIAVNDWDQ